jgi:hypothetical protein
MATIARQTPLRPPKAPNLLIAPIEYRQTYQDQLNNALRLYFNQIDNGVASLLSPAGGGLLQFPNGAFHQDGYTTLTGNISNNSTTPIPVVSTANFLSAGTLLIGQELINYTGKTTTTFTGITRGVYGTTNVAHTSGAYVSEAQAVPSATTALAIVMTNTDTSNQVALDATDKSKIVFAIAGYYNIQFSVQLINNTNAIDNVTFWFRQNTVDIPNTAGIVSVPAKHAGGSGAAIVSWNLIVAVDAGDNIQLMMASNSGNTVACTYPPGTAPVHPASPSVILTATFVSALYP